MKPWTKAIVQGAACGLVLGVVVLLIGGRAWWPQLAAAQAGKPGVAEVVRAQRFEVVDADGKVRASLVVGSDGRPGLVLLDASGKTRASVSVFFDGSPNLFLWDAAGKTRASLGLSRDENPSLELYDKVGTGRAVLGATRLETPKTGEATVRPESSLVLFDKDGKVMWRAP